MNKATMACTLAACCTSAAAQSSVTLYGLIDEGIGYTNSANGHSAWQTQGGWTAGDRWGLKGSEDLGAGLKAIFTLENGFDINSGRLGQSGRMFGRQAFVGLDGAQYGAVTVGRQYDSVVDYLGPLTANGGYAGWPFSHPFDNDNTDNSFRFDNAVKYTNSSFGGFRFGGAYAFSNTAGGFSKNNAYSAGASYSGFNLNAAVVYLQANNPGSNNGGALATDDTTFVARKQRILGGAVTYTLNPMTFGAVYTHTLLENPASSVYFGSLPANMTTLKFDNFEVYGRYLFTPGVSVLAMYTFTLGHFDTATGHAVPKWHQGGLMADYSLSKRTDVYMQGAYQHVAGSPTGTMLDNAFIAGAAGPSSTRSQVLVKVGIMHKF